MRYQTVHYRHSLVPKGANWRRKAPASARSTDQACGLRPHQPDTTYQRPAHVVALGPEDMLDADPNRRTGLVALLLALAQRLVAAALAMDSGSATPSPFSAASISAER